MRQTAARTYEDPPSEHLLALFGPSVVPNLRIDLTPHGWGDYRTLYSWGARVVIDHPDVVAMLPTSINPAGDRFGRFSDPALLATVEFHTVDMWPNSVVESGDAESGALEAVMASAFTWDNEPLPEMEEAMNSSSRYSGWIPDRLATIDEFRVAPAWTGTFLTPYLAAKVLACLTAFGRDSFLLTAHPILTDAPGDTAGPQIRHAQQAIIAMYRAVGFVQYHDKGHMAGWFPENALDDLVERFERDHDQYLTGRYAAF